MEKENESEELNEVEEKHFKTEDLWVFYWEEPAKI